MSTRSAPPRIVLVSHEATRTGAPRMAVNIARVLSQSGYEVITVLRAGGPLAPEFEPASARVVREPVIRSRALLRRFRRTRPLATRLDERVARRVLRQTRPDVAYLNTVKAVCYVRPCADAGIRTVLHVHELEPLASSTLARYPLDPYLPRVALVACFGEAQENLSRITSIPKHAIGIVPSVVDVDRVVELSGDATRDEIVRPSGRFVVGACGTADARKGVDVWLRMASLLVARRPDLDVRFLWVGRPDHDVVSAADRLGIGERVEFTGEVDNPYPLLASMDVVTLPSRTDPGPLVVLEAMALERPIVAFALPGVVAQLGDAGVLVEPGDPAAMSRAVGEVLDDAQGRHTLGARAAARVRERFDLDALRALVSPLVRDQRGSVSTAPSTRAR